MFRYPGRGVRGPFSSCLQCIRRSMVDHSSRPTTDEGAGASDEAGARGGGGDGDDDDGTDEDAPMVSSTLNAEG